MFEAVIILLEKQGMISSVTWEMLLLMRRDESSWVTSSHSIPLFPCLKIAWYLCRESKVILSDLELNGVSGHRIKFRRTERKLIVWFYKCLQYIHVNIIYNKNSSDKMNATYWGGRGRNCDLGGKSKFIPNYSIH